MAPRDKATFGEQVSKERRQRKAQSIFLALIMCIPLTIAAMQVLQRLSFQDSSVSKAMAGEVRILLFNYWFTYCVLRARKPKFQTLESPGSTAVTAVEEL